MGAAQRSIAIATFLSPAFVAAAGIAVSILGFLVTWHAGDIYLQGDFEELAARRLVRLQDSINVQVTLLRSIAGLFDASDFVERREFHIFVAQQPTAAYGDATLEWVPRVPPSQREAIEKAARADGLTDFRIWPNGSPGDGVLPASEAEAGIPGDRDYFPVLYAEPMDANESVFGFDVGSDPVRRAALDRARDTGAPAATGRIRLVPGGDDSAILIAYPIYGSRTIPAAVEARRSDLIGFALGAFRVRQLIETTMRSDPAAGQDIYFYDESATSPEARLLYYWPSWKRTAPAAALAESEVFAAYHWSSPLDVGGRTWTIVFRPAPGYFPFWSNFSAWATFGVGLIVTFLVTAYEWRRSIHTRKIETLAADLGDSYTRLESEIAERRETEEQLRQSQKVEAIGQLTGGVAHDFNNLLTVILGNLEIAKEKLPADSSALPNIQLSLTAAIRGAALTERLLAFARRQVLKPEPLDLNRIVEAMHDLLQRTLGGAVEVKSVLRTGLWPAMADRNQIETALINLAINARDAMPNGGHLTIETQNASLDVDYARHNPGVTPGDYVVLAVTDSGAGMTPETLAQAIEPFFTTKPTGKGTGLGLSSVYGFARQSGGHLKLYSEVGRGTTVRLYLPRAHGLAESSSESENNGPFPRGDESILVVDDDSTVRAVAVSHLSGQGYRVLEAKDGPAALKLIKSGRGTIDVLVTDIILAGGMNGPDVAAEAKRHLPRLQILYMSGYTEDAVANHGRFEPFGRLLQKPFRKADLLRTVRDILDGR